MRSLWKVLCAGSLSLALAGCGDVGTTSPPTSGNGSIGGTVNITVSVAPSAAQTVDAGQSVTLTATITGDTANKGVVWSLPAGSGTLSTTTALTTTYTAPNTALSGVVITATSVYDATKSATATVNVNSSPSFTGGGQLGQGYVGVAYSASVAATGGTGARTFALATGSTLPAGLSLNTTTGAITGTPTAAGSTTFTIAVKDSASTPQTATAAFTIGVSGLQANTPQVVDDIVNRAYPTTNFTSAYGQGTVTYRVSSGSLPAGLTLSSGGVLSGTPTATGTSTFAVTASDSIGQTATTNPLTITVAPVLTFSGGTIPATTAGQTFAGYTVAASGGTPAYTYTLAGGSALPPGLTLINGNGAIAGTPTVPGNYTFTILATDRGTVGTTRQVASAVFSTTINVAPLAITTASLPDGVHGSPYYQQLASSGGIGPYIYSVTSGALPSGLYLSQAGILSGRPAANASYNFTITATDSETTPQTATQSYSVTMSQNLPAGVNDALLNGRYAFVFSGMSNGVLATGALSSGNVYGDYVAGSLTFDGSNLITGVLDQNSAVNGNLSNTAITGSYNIGADNRGKIVLDIGSNVVTLNIAVSSVTGGVAKHFRFIEYDADTPTNASLVQGAGDAYLQDATAFQLASLTGRYVFRLEGETPSASALSLLSGSDPTAATQFGTVNAAGYLQLNGSGLVVKGVEDATSFGNAWNQVTLTGTYTAPDANGRGSMTVTPLGNLYVAAPTHFIYYVIGSNQIVLLSADPHSGSTALAGMAYQQQQTLYSTASLSGRVISYENNVYGGDGQTTYPGSLVANMNLYSFDGNGTLAVLSSTNDNGAKISTDSRAFSYIYSVSDQGRVTYNGGPVFWLYDNNAGVGVELVAEQPGTGISQSVGTLKLDGQTGPFNNSAISGSYSLGTLPIMAATNFINGNATANPANNAISLTLDSSYNGYLSPNNVLNGTRAVVNGSDGQFNFQLGGQLYNGFIISPTKFVYYNSTNSIDPNYKLASPVYVGER